MDPRKPLLVVPRVDELVSQLKKIFNNIKTAKSSHELSAAEREGVLVIQELCLTVPRLHDTMIYVSRNRRTTIANGLVSFDKVEQPKEEIKEIYVAPNQAETVIVEPNYRKKKAKK